ncbi:MAG: hypothetical protein ACYC44_04405, partial [Patescibacteria group bacterium]
MKADQEIKRSFSMILAEAVMLAEIHKIPGLRSMQLKQCDITASPIKQMDNICSPNLTELGIKGYSEHTVRRYIHFRGIIGSTQGSGASYHFTAGCTIFSIKEDGLYWQPYMLWLDIKFLIAGAGVGYGERVYLNGTYDGVSIRKNTDNPCADLCALQSISDVATHEE